MPVRVENEEIFYYSNGIISVYDLEGIFKREVKVLLKSRTLDFRVKNQCFYFLSLELGTGSTGPSSIYIHNSNGSEVTSWVTQQDYFIMNVTDKFIVVMNHVQCCIYSFDGRIFSSWDKPSEIPGLYIFLLHSNGQSISRFSLQGELLRQISVCTPKSSLPVICLGNRYIYVKVHNGVRIFLDQTGTKVAEISNEKLTNVCSLHYAFPYLYVVNYCPNIIFKYEIRNLIDLTF